MNLWLLFILAGVITLLERLSFILWSERWRMPRWLARGLDFVPVTVLSALVMPGILRTDEVVTVSIANPKLMAGMAAALVAWRTQNVLFTIIIGMALYWGWSWLWATP